MSKEASESSNGENGANGALVLDARNAGILLLMSGRAVELGGCILLSEPDPDSVARAAYAIYAGEVEGTLAEAIEAVTGTPPTLHPQALSEMVTQSQVEYAVSLGMPQDEALDQIAA